jgi:7,8-dihydropterin-6-yl-methyl-4-(beta-D-ribofuranosyl)aminobenzene 5'-phosphate synthase
LLLSAVISTAQSANRITTLYDAFGKSSNLKKDWGFSAFVEYDDKRILFDTGNNADTFAQNVKVLGIAYLSR